MKFVCDGLSLSEAVIKVSKACAVRTTAPVMECIKLSAFGEEVTLLRHRRGTLHPQEREGGDL